MRRTLYLAVLMLLLHSSADAQGCTTLGQNPSTAFPVCGTSTFVQSTVPSCVNNLVPVPCNDGTSYYDYNPFWYQFTCYQSGTLGLLITPSNLSDDYDWQIFDVTGHNPNDVYTDKSLFVVGNWSGNSSLESSRGFTGVTGATASGHSNIECSTNPKELGQRPPYFDETTFSAMPNITEGHTYLLVVSHYSGDNQSGYGLSFTGGTAVITDSTIPAMKNAVSKCNGQTVYLGLNKKMKCSSLAANGSDFTISPSLSKTTSASGVNCTNGFDMDSLVINLDKPLPPGDYNLVIQNGRDSNTLLDNCDRNILPGDSIPFTVYPLQPTPMDSLSPVGCAPNILHLVFRNKMKCNSVAADGSDFIVKGTLPVTVVKAYGENCNADDLSSIIDVELSKPIETLDSYNITLQKGTDGNTIIDECGQETPAGQTVFFITADTVSAAFNYKLDLGCVYDTLFYSHDGRNEVNAWNWTFDSDGVSTTEDSFFLFNDYGTKHIQLTCSNGVCTDSAANDILLDNQLISRFKISPSLELCPEDKASFTDSSIGKIVTWYWLFGDGTTSSLQQPQSKKYPSAPNKDGRFYPVALIVKNDINCFDTAAVNLKVLYNCYIAVPTAFTPNGDGLNDYLYPLNAYKADNLEFRVYNRYGQLAFETKDWSNKWDGTINGNPQPSGVYVWMLSYTDRDTGKKLFLKGTTVLIR